MSNEVSRAGGLHRYPPSLWSAPEPNTAETEAMRPEIQTIVDEIQQALSLLRRHL
jgi:hypothetical protein